jgi:hypothetical protein
MSEYNLKTGDLILYCNGGCNPISELIKYFTNSKYTHIAMVIKDPDFIDTPLKGYYIWESNWEGTPDPQDNDIKFGVQITPFDELYDKYKQSKGSIYIRRINCNQDTFSKENLEKIHQIVYDKSYDYYPTDIIEALEKDDKKPQRTDHFWCSALVGCIYTKLNLLENTTDWSIMRPCDFSANQQNLDLINNAILDEEIKIL